MKENPKTHINSSDKATQEWLNSQKEATRVTYQSLWGYFLEFIGMTGDQILEARKVDKEFSWEKRVMEFKEWLIKKGQSEKSAKTGSATVRGFFSYHRVPLQFRRSESAKLSEAKTKYEDYRFSREDLKKMYDVSDLMEKYVVTAGKSFGMRAGDFLNLTKGDLEPYLERPTPISIGEYSTQKESVKAYPFIDSDALPVIKLMIEQMNREGRKDSEEPMLKFKNDIELSRVLKRIAERAGINPGNKIIRFHCLRKFLIDHLSSVMSESKWKQVVGKKISESAYVSPDSLREDYGRAMNETCFPSVVDLSYMKARQEVSERVMSKMMSGEPLNEQDKEDVKRFGLKVGMRRERHHDGGDCGESFEQISESQLLPYLKAGWSIVHRLQSGDLIMKR